MTVTATLEAESQPCRRSDAISPACASRRRAAILARLAATLDEPSAGDEAA